MTFPFSVTLSNKLFTIAALSLKLPSNFAVRRSPSETGSTNTSSPRQHRPANRRLPFCPFKSLLFLFRRQTRSNSLPKTVCFCVFPATLLPKCSVASSNNLKTPDANRLPTIHLHRNRSRRHAKIVRRSVRHRQERFQEESA